MVPCCTRWHFEKKTNKAALATNIKKSAKMAESVPAHSATIIDGMGLVQRAKFDGQQPTFEEVADRIFSMAKWENEKSFQKLGRLHKVLCVTCEDKCYRFSAIQRREVPELQSFHEEADGRLILHATHAVEDGYGGVIVSSNDTDVLVLNLAYSSAVKAPRYQKSGSGTRTQLIDVSHLASTLGPAVCNALIGMHAYTGCDSVSSFAGKGKLTALKILMSDQAVQKAFADLGKD
ncbi:hypothetical protein ACOMHN_021969 [Nucella lapillus]